MQIRARRNALAVDLEPGRFPENLFEFAEIGQARLRRRLFTEQCPEGAMVDGAIGGVIPQRKHQRFDIVAPARFPAQVETARPRPGLTRRKISQAATSPINQATLVTPIRVTIAAVKAPEPPRNGVA